MMPGRRLHNVAIAGLLLFGLLTSLSMSAQGAQPVLRVTPIALATPEQLMLLGRDPKPFESDASIFVQWSAMPDAIFQIRCPEAIVGLDSPYKTFLFVRRQRWQPDGPGGWKFDVPLQVAKFTTGKPYVPYPARLRGWVQAEEDHVDIRFQFVNQSESSLDPQSFWVCFLHEAAGTNSDRVVVPGVSHETLFLRDDGFLPWRAQESRFCFMPANGSALTEAGWQQSKYYEKLGRKPNIMPHPPADGVRAAIITRGDRKFITAITSDDAVVLGGKCEYPCIDLSLGFDELAPGESIELSTTAWFLEGDLNDLLARLKLFRRTKSPVR